MSTVVPSRSCGMSSAFGHSPQQPSINHKALENLNPEESVRQVHDNNTSQDSPIFLQTKPIGIPPPAFIQHAQISN